MKLSRVCTLFRPSSERLLRSLSTVLPHYTAAGADRCESSVFLEP
jgi:hypothetical protein